MDPAEDKPSKTVDIYRDTWVRFLGIYCLIVFNEFAVTEK